MRAFFNLLLVLQKLRAPRDIGKPFSSVTARHAPQRSSCTGGLSRTRLELMKRRYTSPVNPRVHLPHIRDPAGYGSNRAERGRPPCPRVSGGDPPLLVGRAEAQ